MSFQPSRLRSPALLLGALVVLAAVVALALLANRPAAAPVALRLQVALTPEELVSFRPALERIDAAHPEWTVQLELVPQGSEAERVTSDLARGALADVVRVQGVNVQQWIRRGAFAPLDQRLPASGIDLDDFYPGPVDQFRWDGRLWGVPDTASPEFVFYDKAAFRDAGLEPPDDAWTY